VSGAIPAGRSGGSASARRTSTTPTRHDPGDTASCWSGYEHDSVVAAIVATIELQTDPPEAATSARRTITKASAPTSARSSMPESSARSVRVPSGTDAKHAATQASSARNPPA
jgi:hypothetical protein